MRYILFFLLFANFFSLQAQTYRDYYKNTIEAYENNKYELMLKEAKNAHRLRPEHQTLIYNLSRGYALNNKLDSANYWLKKLITIDAENYDIQTEDFNKLKNTQAYNDLLAYQSEMMQSVITSDTAFLIDHEGFHIEDVAYNPFQKSYLLSSINKRNIYSFQEGNLEPLFKKSFPLAITGMEVQDSILWFTAAGFVEAGLAADDRLFKTSKLYKADLKNGVLLDSISVQDSRKHVFGDVVLTENKELLISDSQTNIVYRLRNGELTEWISSDIILSLQGIAQIGEKIFLADYSQGLFVFDTAKNDIQKLQTQTELSTKGIDGLYAYQNGLIMIQNGVTPNRITQLKLNSAKNKVMDFQYLEKNHPAMGEPTLGFIKEDSLFYVANSFWGYNKNGIIKNEAGINPVILKLPVGEMGTSSNPLSVLDYVKILDSKAAETYHYYDHNWAKFRSYALFNGFISGFRMMKSESAEYDIILETQYKDREQLEAIEEHFKKWYALNPTPDLLNELKPLDFRKNVKNETVYHHLDLSKPNIQNQNCSSEDHRAFDFWLGTWEVYNKKDQHIGTNKIHLIQNSCGIQENWTSKGGGAGTSYNFYDIKTQKWYQSWISNSGNALLLSGGFKNGEMQMQSELINEKIDRIKWVPQEDGSVLQIWEISTDHGKTWQEAFWGKYIKNGD